MVEGLHHRKEVQMTYQSQRRVWLGLAMKGRLRGSVAQLEWAQEELAFIRQVFQR